MCDGGARVLTPGAVTAPLTPLDPPPRPAGAPSPLFHVPPPIRPPQGAESVPPLPRDPPPRVHAEACWSSGQGQEEGLSLAFGAPAPATPPGEGVRAKVRARAMPPGSLPPPSPRGALPRSCAGEPRPPRPPPSHSPPSVRNCRYTTRSGSSPAPGALLSCIPDVPPLGRTRIVLHLHTEHRMVSACDQVGEGRGFGRTRGRFPRRCESPT